MSPEEHIAEAERLIEGPNEDAYDPNDHKGYERDRKDNLAEAQVHALLAFAQYEGAACQMIRENRKSEEEGRAKHLAAHDAHTAAHTFLVAELLAPAPSLPVPDNTERTQR